MTDNNTCHYFFILEHTQTMPLGNSKVEYYNCLACQTKRMVYYDSYGNPYQIKEGKNMDRYYEDKMVDITTPELLKM